ncbi:DUF502 domain-containing protein [Pseudohaliea sp.]|uniref:DUF502 domain-containing protein n=1 Tax=Pseudohaliea sp. TaxID=2740289 RepID=UPI0032EC1CE3
MRRLTGLALRGLAVALPFALTIYFVYWSISNIEWAMRKALDALDIGGLYLPGMGVVVFVAILLALGLVARLLVFQSFLALLEQLFEQIPLIKSVYTAIRDFMAFLAGENRASGEVVAIDIAGQRMLGIVSDTDPPRSLGKDADSGDDLVGVFLPMSYQLGGYTIYVPRSRLSAVDMDAESAMRYIMTAGIGRASADNGDPGDRPGS